MRRIFSLLMGGISILAMITSTNLNNAYAKEKKSVEAEGVLWGIFMVNTPVKIERINKFEINSNKKAGSIMFYIKWQALFPLEDCKKILEYGAIPHITWEPQIKQDGKDILYLDNIIKGEYDDYIVAFAKRGKRFGHPYFLRFGHEMNGNWYPWSGAQNGKDPSKYVAAYRHIYEIFEKVGADNAIWIWCFMVEDVPWAEWNDFSKYYPGNKYVDWVGIDGYNWGTTQNWSKWVSFEKLFSSKYEKIISLYPGKPIMIAEFASANEGGDKSEWIKDAFKVIKEKFPKVKAVVWFNIKKECEWRLHSDDVTLKAYSEAISDPYYKSDPQIFANLLKEFKLPENVRTELVALPEAVWERPTVPVVKANERIKVDGNLDEWEGVDPIFIKDKKYIASTIDIWEGEDDISAQVYLMWDEVNLYLAAKVKDDIPFINDKKDDAIWDGDSFELALSVNPSADVNRKAFEPADFQVGFSAGNKKGVVPQTWSWQLKNKVSEAEFIISEKKEFKGYVLEAIVPWKAFSKDFVPEPGMKICFNVALNDADRKDRDTQMVFSGDDSFFEDPSVWGFIVFKERGK